MACLMVLCGGCGAVQWGSVRCVVVRCGVWCVGRGVRRVVGGEVCLMRGGGVGW